MCRLRARRMFHDHRTLQDRRIRIRRHEHVMAAGAQTRRNRRCERDQSQIGIARLDKLRGLRDIFRNHQLWFQGVVQTEMFKRRASRASIGSVFRDSPLQPISAPGLAENPLRAIEIARRSGPTTPASRARKRLVLFLLQSPAAITRWGKLRSAARKISNGAPFRICVASVADD